MTNIHYGDGQLI